MNAHTEAINVVYFRTEQNLLSVLTLEIDTNETSFSDFAILNDGWLPDVCNGKDCTALKIGETCARHDHIICIHEDTTRCDIVLVTHELTVNDIDLSTREGYKRWHSLNKVFRQRSHWYQTVSHHNTSFTNEYNGVHVFLDVEVL